MSAPSDSPDAGRTLDPPEHAVRELLPRSGRTSIEDFVARLDLRAGGAGVGESGQDPARPRVMLNMISTVDGRATVQGRTAALGSRTDRELFHALRAEADAVLVGAGTVRDERYGRIIRDPDTRERRRRRQLAEEPLAVIVSASLDLPADLPLLAEPEARVVVITGGQDELAPVAATVEHVHTGGDRVDLVAAMRELRTRFGVGLVLCEGGPRLNSDLLGAGLVDELYLSLSPQLASGRDELRIVHGLELPAPVEMRLLSVLEDESHLFLRYALAKP